MKTGSRPEEQQKLEQYHRDQDIAHFWLVMLEIGVAVVVLCALSLFFKGVP